MGSVLQAKTIKGKEQGQRLDQIAMEIWQGSLCTGDI